MRFSTIAVLASMAIVGQAAHSHRHAHLHKKTPEARPELNYGLNKRGAAIKLTSTDHSKLLDTLGVCEVGINAVSATSDAWIGDDGTWTNEFINHSGQDLILMIWGPEGSWVNANQPLITISIADTESETISFQSGYSGAFSAIYEDTQLVNGQVSNTWGECTFGDYSTCDVSREVNMDGHDVRIVTPKCTTDMDTCVFKCSSGTTCTYGYVLENCENGSQPGATYGTYAGAPSGGCGGMGSSAKLTTYLS